MTRWKLVPVVADSAMMFAGAEAEREIEMEKPLPFRARLVFKAMLSASPAPGEDVVERVAALLGKEIYCGQDEAAPADNPCKKTWAAYKRRCPECALHPNERNDLARAVLAALEG